METNPKKDDLRLMVETIMLFSNKKVIPNEILTLMSKYNNKTIIPEEQEEFKEKGIAFLKEIKKNKT